MNIANDIMSVLPIRYRDKIFDTKAKFNSLMRKDRLNTIKNLRTKIELDNWNMLKKDIDLWEKELTKIALSTSVGLDIAVNFFSNDIRIEKLTNNKILYNNIPIVICVVKNDLYRIKKFYKHYRNMGIKKFSILDNNSTDGTYEWLIEQDDTDVFRTDTIYTTNRRQSWINRLVSFYGFNKWYMIVDSDELFVYPDMETKSIEDLVYLVTNKKYNRIRTITLDMYPKSQNNLSNDENFLAEYKFFDSDNYEYKKHYAFKCITGGMRVRIFKDNNPNFAPYLTKYPLVYFEKGDLLYNSHYYLPIYKNFDSRCMGALLHYKFLEKDIQKYEEISKSGTFCNNSSEYKQYMKIYSCNKEIEFIYDGSKIYENSSSLKDIQEISNIVW